MTNIDKTKFEKIHTRRIDVTTYDGGTDAIIVEGKLKDDRFQHIYNLTGDSMPPGTVHHMIIRMKVRCPDLTIEDIDVDMPTVPHEECPETRTSLAPVIGMRITSGFTAGVKDLVGGTKGCAHLVALLVSMASAAVQGAWAALARKPLDPSMYSEWAIGVLIDSCNVWRSDGPTAKKLRKSLKANC